MSNLTCIIVEDEPLAAKILSDYIKQLSFLLCKGHFKNALLAAEYLQKNQVDLIFLDIHLPKLKGMNFLRTLPNRPQVIITTAYHQYAVEGFELNVVDYLLKPIEFDRFIMAVNKVKMQQPENSLPPVPSIEKDHLFISVQKKKIRVDLADILFIESQREYIRIQTIKTVYLTKLSTAEIESRLPVQQFARIHRSFIIALNKIDSFTAEEVELKGYTLPIGRGYRDQLQQLLS
ncbi:LytTR family DNA-binding domain-containing protein [Flavihumibacter sp. CACIAM 22H1]|uniref:LytR/AlgR family response regulator transcription factor n=1 Tax=Flavihumibacter sp. CACIAM 22H1 TaxID=1812911 RepID=UPI0007A8BACC|nr:LytTR family DNA-binding domain-containing protein [Flavihumibacter sp. CACIAM 22H1]KYP14331.1 MAG: DNA-binding response regulator [Flavihumibacter sp. CACIAM 22H1]